MTEGIGVGKAIVAFVIGALAASVGTWAWDLAHRPFPPLPRLMQNLPASAVHGSQDKFTERLSVRFPIGSPEAELIHELWLEHFYPLTDLRANERRATFSRMGDVIHDICRRDGTVSWTADAAGRLTAISGFYDDGCP
jgi:hypothetical protein